MYCLDDYNQKAAVNMKVTKSNKDAYTVFTSLENDTELVVIIHAKNSIFTIFEINSGLII